MSPAAFGRGCVLVNMLAGVPVFAQSPVLAPSPVVQSPAVVRSTDATSPSGESICESAGREAERLYALPAGLLLAIGRVESGRWDAALGRVVPWPWAIDSGGDGTLLDSKDAAIAKTIALREAGIRNIDVGCYQVNLASHPDAFADLASAFDPIANADYAARFLDKLHVRLGSWDDAVAAYHSMTPERGIPYRELVFASWSPNGRQAEGEHPHSADIRPSPMTSPSAGSSSGPLVVKFASGAVMQIWTPGNTDATSGNVTIAAGPAPSLPRVVIGKPSLR